MERYLIEVIGNKLVRNSPPSSWVYNIFVDKTYMFGIFTLAIKFHCLFLGIF